jgi:predicted Holliday junction resolvase-like endonuclease
MVNPIIIFLYFHFFVLMGGFYLINLFLAVTNSEFEHIESERKSLIEKKSFFQLIKAKYDLREKEKINKKEKEKKLKEINSKKSNQSLSDLYHKVKEEAFHY